MKPEITKEHQWLQQFVGAWKSEMSCPGKPGEPVQHFRGSEVVRTLGDCWIVGDGTGDTPDGGPPMRMLLLIGYDPAKKKFVGSWAASMMTQLWSYEGELDDTGTRLTLECVGPAMTDPTPGATANYRDVYIMSKAGERSMESYMQNASGEWHRFMTATYTRE